MTGEHIRALKGGSWVHAIDCGDETVLLLSSERPVRVRRAYRPEFLAGSEVVEIVTHRERTFSPKEVVRRAYSRASDPALAAMFRDSEAFAAWCKAGRLAGPPVAAAEAPSLVAVAPARPPSAVKPRPQPAAAKPAKESAAARKPAAKKPAKKARAKASPKRAAPRAKKAPAKVGKKRPAAKAKSKTLARRARRSRK